VSVFLLLFGLLALPLRLHCTTVVALVDQRNSRVLIATDCKVNRETESTKGCKIVEEPNCIAAAAGLYREGRSGFKLRELIRKACLEPGDLKSKAEAFLRLARDPYEKAINSIRSDQPADFARTIANKATEVVFAGIVNGHAGLLARGLVADSEGRVRVERFESVAPRYARAGFFLGLNGHIRAYVKSNPDWMSEDYVSLAQRFVEMEIAAHPDVAGPPISELELGDDGRVCWLSKGACAFSGDD
jgi:hypothetical protein